MLELGAEKNSTIAFPIPMEFLRLLDTTGKSEQQEH
ncbi:hypothetical protein N802_09495 [Knoellia sinensis KCTC 19936]|uniref:Uncharacterized protein n=1 Tax=Knoellia sinensis KCTC 19936 TaxID=1385520 RepID=A0A0A0IZK1_9MICO|nr:hypothetical protein N802_09495 [Knoellia sinensis KCTC 19936]